MSAGAGAITGGEAFITHGSECLCDKSFIGKPFSESSDALDRG